jgi:predicted metalloprotease
MPYRRKKSSTGTIVTVTLVSALVVTAGLIGVLASTSKKHTTSVADNGYDDYPSTSASPFPPSTSAAETSTSTTTTTSTTSATTSASRTTTTTRTTTTSQAPRGPQPVYRTKDNPLFGGENGTNTYTCNLPRWQNSPQAASNFFTAALPCLEAEWTPVLQRANLPYARPKLAFPSGTSWSSACGTTSGATAAAFYCSADSTLYMPYAGLQVDQYGAHPGYYLAVFAHEFGHYVQDVSGVLRAAHQLEYDAGADTAAGLEMSRRVELQAQCFGGMWFAGAWNGKGSIDDTIVREMLDDGYTRGDDNNPSGPRDHGTKKNYGAWQQQGYTKNRTFQCNTYLAPADSVS